MTCPVVIDPPSNNNIVLRGYFAPINYHGKKKNYSRAQSPIVK